MDIFIKAYIPFCMISFILIAMVFPSLRTYKRTGINPVKLGKKTETPHDYIGFIFKLILIIIFMYGVLNSFIEFEPIEYLDILVLKIIGIILSILSLILTVHAQKDMSDSWRIGIDEENKTRLVTEGAFQYIRNPIFAGMLLILASLVLLMPAAFMAYLAVLSCIVINIQVRMEEEFLLMIHGKAYRDYKSTTGRFIPKFYTKRKSGEGMV